MGVCLTLLPATFWATVDRFVVALGGHSSALRIAYPGSCLCIREDLLMYVTHFVGIIDPELTGAAHLIGCWTATEFVRNLEATPKRCLQ